MKNKNHFLPLNLDFTPHRLLRVTSSRRPCFRWAAAEVRLLWDDGGAEQSRAERTSEQKTGTNVGEKNKWSSQQCTTLASWKHGGRLQESNRRGPAGSDGLGQLVPARQKENTVRLRGVRKKAVCPLVSSQLFNTSFAPKYLRVKIYVVQYQ